MRDRTWALLLVSTYRRTLYAKQAYLYLLQNCVGPQVSEDLECMQTSFRIYQRIRWSYTQTTVSITSQYPPYSLILILLCFTPSTISNLSILINLERMASCVRYMRACLRIFKKAGWGLHVIDTKQTSSLFATTIVRNSAIEPENTASADSSLFTCGGVT